MSDVTAFLLALVCIYIAVAFPLNLKQGFAGLLSLALAAVFGVGAYAFSIAQLNFGLSFEVSLLVAMLAAVAAQALVSIPSLRLAELYFVLATLGFQVVLATVFQNWQSVTGGAGGLYGLPPPSILGLSIATPTRYAVFALVLAVLSGVVTYAVAHSGIGLQFRAVSSDEDALAAIGFGVAKIKVYVTMYFAAVAGLAGGAYAGLFRSVNPLSFDLLDSILFQAFIIVGGTANFWGPIIGVLILVGIPEGLRFTPQLGISDFALARAREVAYGLVLIVLMRYRPQGLLP